MSTDWDVVRKNVKFLIALFRPSLAKALSVPLLLAGTSILNPPFWLDILNWFWSNQKVLPQYSGPITTPMYITGWVLIGLSIVVYLIDVWLQIKSVNQDSEKKLIDAVKDHPRQTADLIADRIRGLGFTAAHLQDEKIEKLVREITLLRFFGFFPKEEKAANLAASIIDGELSGGTPQAKARTLALLARYLCVGERVEQAKSWLSISQQLCPTEESEIAQAFIDAIGTNNVDAASGLLKVGGPSNYAAFFMIKKAVEGTETALDWFKRADLTINDLDNDGKLVLVSALLSEHQWEMGLDLVQAIDDDSFLRSPRLAQVSGLTFLVNAIKDAELRDRVLPDVPFAADTFPLADDSVSLALRNRAVVLFKACSDVARKLNSEDIATFSDKYALWLELRNSDTHGSAKTLLQSYFINYTQKTLEYLPLAFAFDIDFDIESIEKEVNRQAALNPKDNSVLGTVRFVLAQTKKSYPAVVEYIGSHRNQMEKAVHPITINMLEVEALAKSGLVEDAEQLLQRIESAGAPHAEICNLKNIIESAKGEDPIALAISQYQQSKATTDLYHLVVLLEREKLGNKYYTYCQELFGRTGQEADAIRVCNAASSLGRFSELHQFLLDGKDIVKRSVRLQVHWAWSLFRNGDIGLAREQIGLLKQSKSQPIDLKLLEINLSIFSGDWESLSVFVEESWNRREELQADDLLQAAQLAKAVSPGRARQILEFCTGKYSDDPKVLASSYFTATTMGWEDNQETSEWLNRAVALSDDNGPLQRTSLEDLKEMMSGAREKNERVYKAYINGDAPAFTVAELLNRTMSDFYLIQPTKNQKTKDVRQKTLVPIFHCARLDQLVVSESIAVDVSSALVLENVGLLRYLFDCFEKIFIPHSFMRWLFEEKQKIAFHQPSQIERAKYFERLVSDGKISVLHPKKISNPELALDAGEELAFILEAARTSPANEPQALVVCSYPAYKVGGSFKEEVIDLSSFHHSLISCSQLMKKLEELAVITKTQRIKALNYLRQHEKEWPTDVEVATGAKLFLDSLSITYLITVDMLEKLSEAGFDVYVFRDVRDRYRSLINYDSIIEDAELKIEKIRKVFSSGLTSGKVVLAEVPPNRDQVGTCGSDSVRPTEQIFQAIKVCDAALIDDRFMNKHRNITFDGRAVPIFTTLDFIEALHHKAIISQEQKLDYRTSLREFGFEFVGISTEELQYHLDRSAMVDGEFKPNKQLRLIRENLLLIRVSDLIQLPRDSQWLLGTMKNIAKVIKDQWSADISLELSRARSSWLYELMGYREWAQTQQIRTDAGIAYVAEVLKINSILVPPESASKEHVESYKSWLDDSVLGPLRDIDPWSFNSLIASTKDHVKVVSQQSISGRELDG